MYLSSASLVRPYKDDEGEVGLGSIRGVRSVAMPLSSEGAVRSVVRAGVGLEGAVNAIACVDSESDRDASAEMSI